MNFFVTFCFFITFSFCLFAQKDKGGHLHKINEINEVLKNNQHAQKQSLSKLTATQYQVEHHKNALQSLQNESIWLQNQENEAKELIFSLENDLKLLQQEYKKMLYIALKNRNSHEKLSFLFSAKTFYQAFARAKYLHQYLERRKNQIEQIKIVTEILSKRKIDLENIAIEKKEVLNNYQKQVNITETLLISEKQLIASLKKKENDLLKNLVQQQKAAKEEIKKVAEKISEATSKKIDKTNKFKEVKENLSKEKKDKLPNTPESRAVSVFFGENKGFLLWPCNVGFVNEKFGQHQHPVYPNVMVQNYGINIRTRENEEVRVVFDGRVTSVEMIMGIQGYTIVVQHGEYFTVYSRLGNFSIKLGDSVHAGEKIGIAGKNADDVPEFQFQVWHGQKRLDPEQWLKQ